MIQTDNEKPEVFKDIFDIAEYNKKKYFIFFQPEVTLSCPVTVAPNSFQSASAVSNAHKSCKESLSIPPRKQPKANERYLLSQVLHFPEFSSKLTLFHLPPMPTFELPRPQTLSLHVFVKYLTADLTGEKLLSLSF